jgi:hypothetical protein
VALETEEELVALLDNDKTRKLSGQYVLLTRRPVRWQILSHPLFKKVLSAKSRSGLIRLGQVRVGRVTWVTVERRGIILWGVGSC